MSHNKALCINTNLGNSISFFKLNMNRWAKPFLKLTVEPSDSEFSIERILIRIILIVVDVKMIYFPQMDCNVQLFFKRYISQRQ